MLSPQWLDELRTRVTLSSVIMRTDKLQRAGREWKACCPFHSENTPSFTVNDEKGFYHCFGCGAHGDVIRWMTDQRGLAFMDAVKELAAEAGMDVPQPDPREAERAERRASLHDVTQAAQNWFVANLHSDAGAKARDYLAGRGISPRTAEKFGFGYAPDSRIAMKNALGQFEDAMLVESGMRIAVDDKEPYDRFRDRLMLPIHDVRGRIIGFGGRILDKVDGVAKYLNSPDTPLFDKGRTLYNLNRAGPIARKSQRLIVAEGYMDVIALAQAGFEDAVAPMGTALTEMQLELLWRVCDKPVLCFDGDAAGQRAAMRAIERALPLLQPGRSLQFLHLPAGKDPDDFIKERGAPAMQKLLDQPMSLLERLWEHEKSAAPLASPEDKAGLKARLLDHADAIQHPDIKSLYRRELLDRYSAFAFPPRSPREKSQWQPQKQATKRWSNLTVGQLSPEHSAQLKRSAAGGSLDIFAQAIIFGLTRHPTQIERHAEALLSLGAAYPGLAADVDSLLEWAEGLEAHGENTISGPATIHQAPDNARFSFLLEGSDPKVAHEDLAEAIALLVERPALDAAIAEATARFDSDPDGAFDEQQRLRKRKLEIESRLGQMARKRAAYVAQDKDQSVGDTNADDTVKTG